MFEKQIMYIQFYLNFIYLFYFYKSVASEHNMQ